VAISGSALTWAALSKRAMATKSFLNIFIPDDKWSLITLSY